MQEGVTHVLEVTYWTGRSIRPCRGTAAASRYKTPCWNRGAERIVWYKKCHFFCSHIPERPFRTRWDTGAGWNREGLPCLPAQNLSSPSPPSHRCMSMGQGSIQPWKAVGSSVRQQERHHLSVQPRFPSCLSSREHQKCNVTTGLIG